MKITVFTPTYNRAETLKRAYASLRNQTCKNFEWIIIDDGSFDNTEEIVKEWLKDNNEFDIIYRKVENGGKHRAINKALDIACGRMFFILDSDDYLTDDAIKKIIEHEETLINNKEKFAGIAVAKGYTKDMLIGTTFKGDYIDATSLERKKNNINGDKAEIFYTDILRKNKFPEFEGEKFITEALVWKRIARQRYKLRWFQDILYICEYRDDGLTKKGNSIFKDSPKGLKLYIDECIKYDNLNLIRRLLEYEYYSNAIYNNEDIKQAANDLNVSMIAIRIGILIRKIFNIIKNR